MTVTVSVSSQSSNPTHHVSLAAGSTTVGLRIKGFPKGFRQYPYSPSSMKFNQGRSGYSSFELPYSSIDQTDWSGGLGQLKFEDPTRYLDGYHVWTVTPGMLATCPTWYWGTGYRNSDTNFGNADTTGGTEKSPINLIDGSNLYRFQLFTASATYSADKVLVYAKHFGANPGQMTVEIWSDDGSNTPNAMVKSKTVNPLTDFRGIAKYYEADFTGTTTLNDGTKYHIVVYGASGKVAGNCWSLPVGADTSEVCGASSDGSNWVHDDEDAAFQFRVTDADTSSKMHFFEHKRGLYAASEPDNGSAGKIFINGDRGVATGSSSSTTLKDTDKSWTTNEWSTPDRCYVYIWKGTGTGQLRKIGGNTSDTLTVDAWDITPVAGNKGTGSEYVILGSRKWTDITPSGSGAETITKPITSVISLWEIIYFAQGSDVNILRCREYNDTGTYKTFWGGNAASGSYGTQVSKLEGGTNWADHLAVAYDPVNENIIWRSQNADANGNNSVSRADDVTWNDGDDGTGTDLSFPASGVGGPTPCGPPDYLITNIIVYNNFLYVGKEDSVWYIENDGKYDRAYPIPVGLEAMASRNNCKAMLAKDLFLYFNLGPSLERLYGSTLDDIGPWRDYGLLQQTKGYIADMASVTGWIISAIDAGEDRYSSVMIYKNGWHPIWRAWTFSRRIRSVHWQHIDHEDSPNWLWFECNGDFMRMGMPNNTLNPSQDDNISWSNEGYIITSIYDANYAALEKYFKEVSIVGDFTAGGVTVDYLTDSQFGDGNTDIQIWNIGTETQPEPEGSVSLAQSRKRNIMLRIRIRSEGTIGQNYILATVLEAVARTPVKFNWDMRVALDDNAKTLTGAEDHEQDTLLDQIVTWSGQPQALTYRCVDPFADDSGSGRTVFVEPPNIFRRTWNKLTRKFFGYATVTLREL